MAIYPRWQRKTIEKAMLTRRVLLLSGPRQCGKTTLAKQLATEDTIYRTLDDLALRQLVENDPNGFVRLQAKCKLLMRYNVYPICYLLLN